MSDKVQNQVPLLSGLDQEKSTTNTEDARPGPLVFSSSLAGSPSNGMSEQEMLAVFLLAEIRVDGWSELVNPYWPDVPEYAHLRKGSPWWRVDTSAGPITIGWRKRVISIDWRDTGIYCVVTKDDTTKGPHTVHAWSYAKAVEYLAALKSKARHGT